MKLSLLVAIGVALATPVFAEFTHQKDIVVTPSMSFRCAPPPDRTDPDPIIGIDIDATFDEHDVNNILSMGIIHHSRNGKVMTVQTNMMQILLVKTKPEKPLMFGEEL